jgi:hypothetical protein
VGVSSLPFAHLNLRRNPFGELDPGEWAGIAVAELSEILAQIKRPGTVVQLVGRCGRGKTTHLHALARALPGATYVRADTDRVHHVEPTEVLLLDEADHLWAWRRRRLLRAATSSVLATHRDLGRELRRAGYRSVRVEVGGLDVPRLQAITTRRIEAARREAGALPSVAPGLLQALVTRHGDDLRAITHDLYDRFQALSEVCVVEV